MAVKRKKYVFKKWTVAEKLEVVQARQRGLTLAELWSLYRVNSHAVAKWVKAHDENGIAGLEQTGNRAVRGMSARVAAAEQVLDEATRVAEAAPATRVGTDSWDWHGKRCASFCGGVDEGRSFWDAGAGTNRRRCGVLSGPVPTSCGRPTS
jgi:transposase-like protein